jgi:FkbM family methyltransferase
MHDTLKRYQQDQSRYERVVGEIIRTWPRGNVHIDCGAHAGLHTAPMLERSDVRRVYAVEAIEKLCDRLDRLFPGNPKLRLIRAAVGKQPGRAAFAVAVDAPGYSGLRQRSLDAVAKWETVTVAVDTLDSVVSADDRRDVGLIKLDLEGGEFDALSGATDILERARPCLVFENGLRTSAAHYGYSWNDFERLFETHGYQVFDFFGNRVDEGYWNATLQTYMFVGIPAPEAQSPWFQTVLPAIVRAVADEPTAR